MTDTPQNPHGHVPFIFLGGPIKHWWTCWDSPEHKAYMRHRDWVKHDLIEAGYLCYSPWNMIQGSWDQRAQQVNLFAISCADLFLNLTPPGIPAEETEAEQEYAYRRGVKVAAAIPGLTRTDLLAYLTEAVGPGVPYA